MGGSALLSNCTPKMPIVILSRKDMIPHDHAEARITIRTSRPVSVLINVFLVTGPYGPTIIKPLVSDAVYITMVERASAVLIRTGTAYCVSTLGLSSMW